MPKRKKNHSWPTAERTELIAKAQFSSFKKLYELKETGARGGK